MKRDFEAVKRIVIKIGTSSLVLPNGKINLAKIDQLAFVISSLVSKGKEIVLVSSGAMGFGLNVLNMEKRPAEMAQQQASHAVQTVFRHLASVLHPDRETDPAERARKTALMQRVTLAYHAHRLVDLLELQREVAQADMGDMTSLSEEQLQSYIRVLKQQSEELAHELQQREMWLRARYPLNRFQKAIRPRDLARILREVRAGVKHQLQQLDALKARLATEQGVRAWLKSLRQQTAAQMRMQENMASLVGGLIRHPPGNGF